jgi:hypothetical protein
MMWYHQSVGEKLMNENKWHEGGLVDKHVDGGLVTFYSNTNVSFYQSKFNITRTWSDTRFVQNTNRGFYQAGIQRYKLTIRPKKENILTVRGERIIH